jgi:hypothetical protein
VGNGRAAQAVGVAALAVAMVACGGDADAGGTRTGDAAAQPSTSVTVAGGGALDACGNPERMVEYRPVPVALDEVVGQADVVAEVTFREPYEQVEEPLVDEGWAYLVVDTEVTKAFKGAEVGDTVPVLVESAIFNPQAGGRAAGESFVHADWAADAVGSSAVVATVHEGPRSSLLAPPAMVRDDAVEVDACGPPFRAGPTTDYERTVEALSPGELATRLDELVGA